MYSVWGVLRLWGRVYSKDTASVERTIMVQVADCPVHAIKSVDKCL